ncbi:amidohydrolase family protein [Paracandidimonas soli]|uniref:Putative TIM-barrel fold metal-dependent hydrolase n=1 Tax=Paracandidimonas soli TaxID=1917182 RepID=A0A4R3UU55_9BURK|nr:amidohydrolase family protein [Paracandidimonas soli]TCU94481.1 putative TIM-barrel fold metal-dependent hydrolase [Paracandidimonas soli]
MKLPLVRDLPAGACDTHLHVFGPVARFPYSPGRSYTPDDAPFETLQALHRRLGLQRGVIVQPGCHGYDMSAALDAVRHGKGQYRAVALVRTDVSSEELASLNEQGVRGVRFNFIAHLNNSSWSDILSIAERVKGLGWHLCLHSDQASLAYLLPRLPELDLPVIIDHMGRIDAAAGPDNPALKALLKLKHYPRAWIKISGLDRCSSTHRRPFDDAVHVQRAFLDEMPERLLWGSDWPHPNIEGDLPDEAELLNQLLRACPDDATLKRILVENPQHLYGFTSL